MPPGRSLPPPRWTRCGRPRRSPARRKRLAGCSKYSSPARRQPPTVHTKLAASIMCRLTPARLLAHPLACRCRLPSTHPLHPQARRHRAQAASARFPTGHWAWPPWLTGSQPGAQGSWGEAVRYGHEAYNNTLITWSIRGRVRTIVLKGPMIYNANKNPGCVIVRQKLLCVSTPPFFLL